MAKKHLGQHFLISDGVLKHIIEGGRVSQKDTVLEIGPGQGALTEHLLETGATVIAIEKDHELIPYLNMKFESYIRSGKLVLHEGDALSFDYRLIEVDSYKVIANIPYYITGALFRTLFSLKTFPELVLLMIQKEVAERVTQDNKENKLSLSLKCYGTTVYLETVPAAYFKPAPKVDSALLLIKDISRDFFEVNSFTEKQWFEIINKSFAQKRKTLLNNLFIKNKDAGKEVLARIGKGENVRAEALSLEDFRRLVTILTSENISEI